MGLKFNPILFSGFDDSGSSGGGGSPTGPAGGDLSGTYPNPSVAFVGTSSASLVHTAELLANAATSANSASTIVKRDPSGNFSASTINANLIGDVTGTSSGNPPNSRAINTTAPLTGGGNLSADRTLSIPQATTSVDGYLAAADFTTFNNKQPAGSYITALTGDVTASGPGSSAATVVFIGGTSASLIASGASLANAATDVNSVSTIVRRDINGSFSASTIVTNSSETQFEYYLQGTNQLLGATFIISPTSSFITVSSTGNRTSNISTPISAGTKGGQIFLVKNIGSFDLTLKAGGNCDFPAGLDYVLTPKSTITLVWDSSTSTWTTIAASAN